MIFLCHESSIFLTCDIVIYNFSLNDRFFSSPVHQTSMGPSPSASTSATTAAWRTASSYAAAEAATMTRTAAERGTGVFGTAPTTSSWTVDLIGRLTIPGATTVAAAVGVVRALGDVTIVKTKQGTRRRPRRRRPPPRSPKAAAPRGGAPRTKVQRKKPSPDREAVRRRRLGAHLADLHLGKDLFSVFLRFSVLRSFSFGWYVKKVRLVFCSMFLGRLHRSIYRVDKVTDHKYWIMNLYIR